MEKLNLQSVDKVQSNIEKIRKLFPNCVTEVKRNGKIELAIDFEMLKQEMSNELISDQEERYQFTWPDKKKSILTANSKINKTLRPCKEESVDFDNTQNLYIEGDNLDVLKLLQETYMQKIKMIYIDPPYNTGKDFVYKDKFNIDKERWTEESGDYNEEGNRLVQNLESNGRYHTDWLNMIYPRLKLARDLLTDDGVIFISIDDNEVHNLRKICDEVFGEDNFVSEIAWRRTDNQPNIGNCAKVKEYLACYCKSKMNFKFGRLPLSEKAKNEYRYSDDNGKFRRAILLDKTRGRHLYNIKTKNGNILNGPWMIKENEFYELDKNNGIYWTHGGDEQPYGKIYLHKSKGQIPNDFWGIEFGTNQRASLEVEVLFEKRLFDFPKPVSLIMTLLILGLEKGAIILDFFSGSATTAHAVMQLNAEDGGNRKHICVQLPEVTDEKSEAFKAGYKNICEIGKERVRRAGQKILEDNKNSKEPKDLSNLDIGFRVLKLDSSNMKDVFHTPQSYRQTTIDGFEINIKEDRTAEDLLFQVMLDMGVMLDSKIIQMKIGNNSVYVVGEYSKEVPPNLIACFDSNLQEGVVTEIAKLKPLYAVFRDSSFDSDSVAVNFDQIFKTYSPSTERRVV